MAGWSDPAHRLDAERLADLFREVDWQLGLTRLPGSPPTTVIVCGGAAMCYQLVSRGTGDVDVMYPPMPPELRQAVRTVARRRSLDAAWMNDGPAQFARYGPHVASVTLFEGPHLVVSAPTNDYLLGMKVSSARGVDVDDAVWLMAKTGLRTKAELHAAATAVCRSTNEEWNPERHHNRFIRACMRQHRRRIRALRRAARRPEGQQDPTELDPLAPIVLETCGHIGVISRKPCILPPHAKETRHRY